MACCIAITLVVALVRGVFFAVVPGRRPEPLGFAPPARRSAPGAPAAPRAVTAPPPDAGRGAAGPAARALTAGAATTAAFAATIEVLRRSGGAVEGVHPLVDWAVRGALLALLAVTALAAAALLRRPSIDAARTSPGDPRPVFVGAGLAWTALALLELHVLGLYHLASHGVVVQAAFHAPGVLALAAAMPQQRRPVPLPT